GKLIELAQTRQNTATGEAPTGMMAELMAGIQNADNLPADAAEKLAQLGMAPTDPASDAPLPTPQGSLSQAKLTFSPELTQVTQALAQIRNYEPQWLQPHLTLIKDLGLTRTEVQTLLGQLGVTPNGHQDWTVEELAASLRPSVVTTPAPPPQSAHPLAPLAEDWVLILGQGSPDQPQPLEGLVEAIQQSAEWVISLPSQTSGQPFAVLVNRLSPTLASQITNQWNQSAGQTRPEQGIWWGSLQPTPPAMAWLFPGSGSIYPGLLEEWQGLPVVQQVLQTAQKAFQQIVDQELTFTATTDPLWQRPATVTISTAMARLFEHFGLQPAWVAGHSVGELTACHIAGAFDLTELIRLTTAPFKDLPAYPKGSMAALIGPEAITRRLVQAMQGRVVISNRNSTQQLVVSGEQEDIKQLMALAQKEGIQPHPLQVETAYHSPILATAHQYYRQALQQSEFQLPRIPVISGLTGDFLPWSSLASAQVRALLDCAFIAPVNHVAQLQRLQSLGCGLLLDIGPTDRLARLAKETVDTNQILLLGANRPKRSGRLCFLEALAQLHVLGFPIQAPLPPAPEQWVIPIPTGSPSQPTHPPSVASPEPPISLKTTPTPASAPIHSAAISVSVAIPQQAQPTDLSAGTHPQGIPNFDWLSERPALLDPIAVIGMGGILPDAVNIQQFWQNLLAGHSAIREIPQDASFRWKLQTFYNPDFKAPDKTYSKIGAFVPNFEFKPIEFRITPKTALQMDRSQKMALLATREALKDSGYYDKEFDRTRVRVIIGTSIPEFHDLAAPRVFFDEVAEGFQASAVFQSLPPDIQSQMIEQARQHINKRIPASSEDSMPGGLPNIVAGRVAYCFDLQGGNVVLDAACAASLAALDHAVKSLRMGEVDMVVMGGSDSAMSAGSYVGFCKTYALSAKGSYPFDAKADGFVMGEGSGILLLKRLRDAEAAGDKIHAVIRGTGSSSDGRGRGITAPSQEGQVAAMRHAYADAGVDPATIGLVEAHGTSTPLGDATEFASLAEIFGESARQRPVYLGSVKSMVGHLKTSAGVAGLIKAILSVQQGKVPPTLNFETPNPKIDQQAAPFIINTTTCEWEHTEVTPRRAGVNSFGFGGTNFHVIVEAYDPEFYRSEAFRRELRSTRIYREFYQDRLASSAQPQSSQDSLPTGQAPEVVNLGSALHKLEQPLAVVGSPQPTPTHFPSTGDLATCLSALDLPLAVLTREDTPTVIPVTAQTTPEILSMGCLRGWVPAIRPQDLGSPSFRQDHGVKFNYIAGAMAGGIGSVDIVVAMAKAGMLGFFGSGGLDLGRVEKAILEVKQQLIDHPHAAFGFNLLHNPIESGMEERTVDLYLQHGVHKVSASAYLRLMPSVVRYRATGMQRLADGRIVTPNRVFAKVSSLEVASQFMAPPPAAMLKQLVAQGKLTIEEAELAALLPVAQDITAEADSGGHTDRRPLSVLLPQMIRLRDEVAARHQYQTLGIDLRVGSAGSIGDPLSARAALALGADYLLTGSMNQSSWQAGTSHLAKEMLAKASMTDVVMAPAADMFEMGVQVQILKGGSFYAQRAKKLYDIYKTYDGLEAIPAEERAKLERDLFRQPLAEVWASTAQYWRQRDPKNLEKAERDPKFQMALTFRAYLGLSSRWAQSGQADRKSDYQIWCGPAMGLFNNWVAGSWLEPLENRDVVLMGLALLHGAAFLTRADHLSQAGIRLAGLSELARPAARELLLTYL
ncbi:MAG: PfaD family polyunsaturated fatty acid/polyketide biosynthesis protein, partial [Cyanobacteriota bacterium]|nr:PfaD family polyunsaturated fatty acid/polyketide biosynthesis protein [Cyanobacteriota bacterium]